MLVLNFLSRFYSIGDPSPCDVAHIKGMSLFSVNHSVNTSIIHIQRYVSF